MHRNVHLASENDERTAEVSGVWEPPSCTSWGVLRGRWGDTPGTSDGMVTAWSIRAPEPEAAWAVEGRVSRGSARPGGPEQAAAVRGRRHVSQLGLPVFKPSQDGEGTQGQLSF